MREIKFRGKVKEGQRGDSFDWVYGDLIREIITGRTFILDLSHFDENTKLNDILIEVEPETVGQFTGLIDKNVKEIYEGDIVTYLTQNLEAMTRKGIVIWDNKMCAFFFHIKINERKIYDWLMDNFDNPTTEVIGNIYQNKELLEANK
jgi:uncharacterized phage protein (TIGR01671 family)